MLIEMRVHGIALDPITNVPIVILRDEGEKNTLPIWIGAPEASAIASEMEKLSFSRPMTHDLMKKLLSKAEISVTRVEVTDIRENVYYARVYISSALGEAYVDARPSDAIALALRANAPILVEADVIVKSKDMDMRTKTSDGEMDEASPGELAVLDEFGEFGEYGKYKM